MVFRKMSEGRKLETRNAQAPPRTTSVIARRAHASRRVRPGSAASLIDAAPRPPRDAQHVGQHPGRMAREANRRVLVVHQAERLLADPVAGLPGAHEDLRLEGEARHLEKREELLGDGGAVAFVGTVDMRGGELYEAVQGLAVDDVRQRS